MPILTAAATPSKRRRAELLIVLVILAVSGAWGMSLWSTWTARGGKPSFYQPYFEPAVMVACGKGFVIADVQPKPLEEFLFQRRDAFSCEDIPSETKLGTRYLYQGAWRYLLVSVGLAWRVLGVSWSGMGPIFGLLFGLTIALSYGVFRLGMGRVVATGCALCLAVSSTHLLNLPHLRDYAKAPFTLGLVLLLGILVTRPVRGAVVIALAAACGIVLGVGYGFRTDFLVNLPVPIVTIFAFLDGGLFRNLRLKAVAAVVFLATFVAVSWPVTSTVYTSGGCQWHVSLLGLQAPFDRNLAITPAPYDFGHLYSDPYIDRTVRGYYWRSQPASPALEYCSHEYDMASGQYMSALVTAFPADFIARSYASLLQIVELPLQLASPPLEGWSSPIYEVRLRLIQRASGWGLPFAILTVLVTAASSPRLAVFLLCFLAYFGGYPAIQFQERHYFHLEFMGWWGLGFVAQRAITASHLVGSRPETRTVIRGAIRASLIGGVAATALIGGLSVARWYQARQVRELLGHYIAAPKTVVEVPGRPLPNIGQTEWPQLLEVDLDETACGDKPAVTFHYDKTNPSDDFTRTVTIDRRSRVPGLTRVFLPVFEKYAGLEIAGERPGCLVGVYRVSDLRPFPILVGATLPHDWDTLPLYQRVTAWERGRGN